MLLSEFDYHLPEDLIARRPLAQRDASRMMLLDRAAQTFSDHTFTELPQILRPGDLLVLNNTRVIPARLLGRRRGASAQPIGKNNPRAAEFLSGEVELLLTRREGGDIWQGLVHPGRKIRTGEILVFGDGSLEAEVLGRGASGVRRVRLTALDGTADEQIERIGQIPIPPYLHRAGDEADREAYQTVYASAPGAVAAPTAGLHFTPRVLDALRRAEIESCELTLHIGPGTFRPVKSARIEEHRMDSEWYSVPSETAEAVERARAAGRRIIATGTTCTRVLEYVAQQNRGAVIAGSGDADLYITPGFEFQVVNGLLTNFHLPRSTLLMLVCAFAGRELIFRAYEHAMTTRYRFYSYGDCMLIL